jgi:hypothetical protein
MILKYEKEITRLNCNLDGFIERERPAYCWTFDPISDSRNFVPRAIAVERDGCTEWALSFFESQKQAKEKMGRLTRKNPQLYNVLGTHIASGVLKKEDGISGNCNSEGHFNHFEYVNVELRNKFTIIDYSYQ